MVSAMPAWIMAMPETAASMPEMQTRLMVTAVTRVRDAGQQGRHPRHIQRIGGLHAAAEAHVVDPGRVDAGALDRRRHGCAGDLGGMGVAQRAPEGTDGCPASGNDDYFFHMHSFLPSLRTVCKQEL
jgi:hypothetical protein